MDYIDGFLVDVKYKIVFENDSSYIFVNFKFLLSQGDNLLAVNVKGNYITKKIMF